MVIEKKKTNLAQKAKIKWSVEGDENTKYFHGMHNKKKGNRRLFGGF